MEHKWKQHKWKQEARDVGYLSAILPSQAYNTLQNPTDLQERSKGQSFLYEKTNSKKIFMHRKERNLNSHVVTKYFEILLGVKQFARQKRQNGIKKRKVS